MPAMCEEMLARVWCKLSTAKQSSNPSLKSSRSLKSRKKLSVLNMEKI